MVLCVMLLQYRVYMILATQQYIVSYIMPCTIAIGSGQHVCFMLILTDFNLHEQCILFPWTFLFIKVDMKCCLSSLNAFSLFLLPYHVSFYFSTCRYNIASNFLSILNSLLERVS